MIRFEEDDVPGNPGAPETPEAEARRIALDALAQPIDLEPPGRDGEAAQAIGDAWRSQGGAIETLPQPSTSRRVVLTEEDVPAFDGAPAAGRTMADPGARSLSAPFRPASAPMTMGQKSATDQRAGGSLDAELRAAREQTARRVIGNSLGSLIEIVGSAMTGAPVRPGAPVAAGEGEDQGRILREHRLGAMQKEREGQAAEAARARAEREATLDDREMTVRERMAEIAAQRANRIEEPSGMDAARTDQIRAALADREARRDPFSPQSRAAQDQFLAVIDAVPPSQRERLVGSFTEERVRGMSADSLAAPTSQLARITPRVGGGSGNPAAASATRERYSEMVDLAVEGGMERAVAESMPREALARLLATQAIGTSQERQQRARQEILPGVSTSLAISAGEAADQREAFSNARASYANLSALDDIAARGGARGVLSPQQRGMVEPRLAIGRGMVANLARLGIIQPSEVDNINGTLPNPNELSQMTLGTLQSRLSSWRGLLEESVRAGLGGHGVDEAGVERAIRFLRSGRPSRRQAEAPEGAAPTPDRVRVRGPDGAVSTVPRAQVDLARRRGYEVVDAP